MSETNAQEQKPITETQPPVEVPSEVVPKEAFDRMKSDFFKQKALNENLQKVLEDQKLQRLKETQNWEEVAKVKEQEAEQARTKAKNLESAVVQYHKELALHTEAAKSGMIDLDLLGVLDMPEVQVETTSSGKIVVHGASAAIQSLKTRKPHLFKSTAPSINPQTPEVVAYQSTELNLAYLNKLEEEYKKNPSLENKKKYSEAIIQFKTKK